MITKYFFLSLMAFDTLVQSLISVDQYLLGIKKLIPSFDKINLYDGPVNISNTAVTTPIKITKPTREEMVYYSFYTAAVNCAFGVRTMECDYCPMIVGDIKENSTHDTSALVALSVKRKEIVVAFRATVNFWNVILDAYLINTSPEGAEQIKIHRGMYVAAMSLYDRVVKTVEAFRLMRVEYKDYRIVVTGYSLGAAMARITQFLLLHLNEFPGVPMEVYTYGEPRSGKKFYADYLNSQNVKTARITNRADLVCHLSPTSMLGTTIIADNYVHVLNEYWINNGQEKFADQSVYEDLSCANSNGPQYELIDHLDYFNVNYKPCLLSEFQEMFAIPVVLHPVDVSPPLPKPIRTFLNKVGGKFK